MSNRHEVTRNLEERLKVIHSEQNKLDKEAQIIIRTIESYRKLENGTHVIRTRAPASTIPSTEQVEEYLKKHPDSTSKEVFIGGGFSGSNSTIDNRLKTLRKNGRATKSDDFPARWSVVSNGEVT